MNKELFIEAIEAIQKQVQLDISKTLVYKDGNVTADEINEIKTSSPEDLIYEGFNQIEKEVKNDLLEKLKTIDPYYFEKVILTKLAGRLDL